MFIINSAFDSIFLYSWDIHIATLNFFKKNYPKDIPKKNLVKIPITHTLRVSMVGYSLHVSICSPKKCNVHACNWHMLQQGMQHTCLGLVPIISIIGFANGNAHINFHHDTHKLCISLDLLKNMVLYTLKTWCLAWPPISSITSYQHYPSLK